MNEEYFDLLDKNGNKLGKTKLRKEVHKDGDWHKAVHVWVINPQGELLLQKRCPFKDSYPNMLDISCAGHLSAGDDSTTGAIRELKEELNIDAMPNDLIYLGTVKQQKVIEKDFINNEFNDIYVLRTNKTIGEMKFQEEEISEIFFVSYEKLKSMVENKQKDLIMHPDEFPILFDWIEKNILS